MRKALYDVLHFSFYKIVPKLYININTINIESKRIWSKLFPTILGIFRFTITTKSNINAIKRIAVRTKEKVFVLEITSNRGCD